ncbi:uncharacterized protein V1516DRAFT_161265 [Lipomyces oligophaga]|uniref:uncharacterized protein n=1 Tax=Lipomyces oligophaga TaxID=45792 RepID=UPI0034CFBAE6
MAKSAGGVAFSAFGNQSTVYRISAIALICWALLHFIFSSSPKDGGMSNEQAQTAARIARLRKIDNADVGPDGFKLIVKDHFADYYGAEECKLQSNKIYNPMTDREGNMVREYCPNKQSLLRAMSGGGRIGFDSPYHPLDCEYRWFDPEDICMILDRFDAVIFIGEPRMTTHIYAAFNSLLRKNLVWGALKDWELNEPLHKRCRCEAVYTNNQCGSGASGISEHFIVDSTEILEAKDQSMKQGSPYVCNRVFHAHVSINQEPVPAETVDEIEELLTNYHKTSKPVPIILQQGLSHAFNWDKTTKVMDTILQTVEKHEPNPNHRPFLWLGPTSAGHLKPPGAIIEQGNNALYHFITELTKRAHDRNFDTLNLYNLTLQAESYDGTMYGQEVSLTTAMMIINWLSRVESL